MGAEALDECRRRGLVPMRQDLGARRLEGRVGIDRRGGSSRRRPGAKPGTISRMARSTAACRGSSSRRWFHSTSSAPPGRSTRAASSSAAPDATTLNEDAKLATSHAAAGSGSASPRASCQRTVGGASARPIARMAALGSTASTA